MTSAEVPVLVVGAGPTGLLLAAELQRRGVNCRLIDANPAPLHWDRATVVHPRSLEVFESLGLLAPFLAAGVKQRVARLHGGGSVLGEIDLSLCGSRHGFNLGISEEVTEAILTDYLHRQGSEIVRSCRLVALEANESDLRVTIARDGSTEEVSAHWVVGCDGLHSTTRELSGIELAGHDIPEAWAVFDVTLNGWSQPYEANYAYLDEIPVILTALPDRRWRVYLRPSTPNSDLVTDASATIGRYHPAIGFDAVANPRRFQCHTKVATHFRAGRVLLAGDSAHICSPAQGHGMNSGLQDAYNLAWKLALVCHGYSAPDVLDSYEAERRPVAVTVTATGDAADRAQTLTDPAERRARDQALRAMFADPSSRHHEAIAEAELDIDYGASPIVMGDAHQSLGPGQRLPDTIPVRQASGEGCGLHELTYRAGHTALLIGGASSRGEDLTRLAAALRRRSDGALIDATLALGTRPGNPDSSAWLAAAGADQLGVGELSLLVVRPDGHVGLRADRDHLEALAAYQALLALGRTSR
jgi:2-polyprenyl-6-methoxyphenol hydroxylase-like FAD-dependent oxidoreductase